MSHDDYSDLVDDDDTRAALETLEGLGNDAGDAGDVAGDDVVVGDEAEAILDASAARARRNVLRMYTSRVDEGGEPASGPFGDDFTRLRQQIEDSKRRYPGDTLAQQAYVDRAQIGHVKALASAAPKIDDMPPSWTRAIVGGGATVSPGQQPQEVATWVGDDLESRPVSIIFSPAEQITSGGVSGDTLSPFVRIQFGTRRGLIQVDIDVGTGGQLTVPASVVHVLVGLDAGGTLAYGINAVIGYFAIARTTQLTRSSYMNNLLGGSANRENFTRPLFASGVLLERTLQGGTTPEIQLDFLDLQAVTRYSRVIAANTYLDAPIQLSNDIVSVDVTNNGTACQARLIWVLNL